MNSASKNLTRHLGVLRQRLEHATDYELAVHYFLEEFAGDIPFLQQSVPEEAPHLLAVLTHIAAKALGKSATFDQSRMLHLPEFGFFHGNGIIDGQIALFFYFEQTDTGLLALVPGPAREIQVARFRLKAGLGGNPKRN